MKIISKGGELKVSQRGTLKNYQDVWYDPNAITNILGLHNVKKKGYLIFYDSDIEDAFVLTKPDGKNVKFSPSPDGLYFHDTKKNGISLLNTVEEN